MDAELRAVVPVAVPRLPQLDLVVLVLVVLVSVAGAAGLALEVRAALLLILANDLGLGLCWIALDLFLDLVLYLVLDLGFVVDRAALASKRGTSPGARSL